jgi:hypothetical protein
MLKAKVRQGFELSDQAKKTLAVIQSKCRNLTINSIQMSQLDYYSTSECYEVQ